MIRPLLLVSVAWLASSFAPVQEKAPVGAQPPLAAAKASIRVHIADHMSLDDTWFEDRWRHAVGEEVDLSIKGTLDTKVSIEFASKKARKTSGCCVTLFVEKGPNGITLADAQGRWWLDLGVAGDVRDGDLTNIAGDVYLTQEFIKLDPPRFIVKFALRARAKDNDVILMGAGSMVVPNK